MLGVYRDQCVQNRGRSKTHDENLMESRRETILSKPISLLLGSHYQVCALSCPLLFSY
jgi:hypothetical protein